MPAPYDALPAWMLLGAFTLAGWACYRSKRALPLFDVVLLVGLAVMALKTARYHIAFAAVATPIVAEQLADIVSPYGFARKRVNLIIAATAATVLLSLTVRRVRAAPTEFGEDMPEEGVQALLASPVSNERGFNYFDWGGYLIYEGVETFVDGRMEPFLDGTLQRYVEVERNGDLAWLESEQVRWILDKPENRLSLAPRGRDSWQVGYRDNTCVLWLRKAYEDAHQ